MRQKFVAELCISDAKCDAKWELCISENFMSVHVAHFSILPLLHMITNNVHKSVTVLQLQVERVKSPDFLKCDSKAFIQHHKHSLKMRQGLFELFVIGNDGVVFEERQLGDAHYVCALPGTEYRVRVTLHRDLAGNFPVKYGYRLVLYIDGAVVSSRVIDLRLKYSQDFATTTFVGFVCWEAYEAFVFSAPQIGGSKSSSGAAASSRGKLEIAIYEAEELEDLLQPQAATPQQTKTPVKVPPTFQLVEDKKFWQQASLETVRGKVIPFSPPLVGANTKPIRKWKNLRAIPDAKLALNYHMPDVINFIGEHVLAMSASTSSVNPLPNSSASSSCVTSPAKAISSPWKPIVARTPDVPHSRQR